MLYIKELEYAISVKNITLKFHALFIIFYKKIIFNTEMPYSTCKKIKKNKKETSPVDF